MSDYNGLARSEWRLEVARQRAAKQKRIALIVALVLAVLLILLAWASLRRSASVPPPSVTVEWPSPQKYGRRTFSPVVRPGAPIQLATLVIRRGQPFTVTVENPANWTVRAISTDTDETGPKITWAPVQDGKLKLFCRLNVGGWKRLFRWALPNYEMHLEGVSPKVLLDGRLQLSTKSGTTKAGAANAGDPKAGAASADSKPVWLSSEVVTAGDTAEWDERAIPLAQVGPPRTPIPRAQADASGGATSLSRAPRWTLVNSFGPASNRRATGDTGTYLLSNQMGSMPEVVDATTAMARYAAEAVPRASIKFIVAEREPTKFGATLRFDFDGTGTRGGWVKHPGEQSATPLRWWDRQIGAGLGSDALSPALPRR